MANRKMKMPGKPKMKVPTPKAVYKKRVAKPEPDMIARKPRPKSNRPKGFI